MNSIIEKPGMRKSYNNKAWRNFACENNIGVAQTKEGK
jgi:hypothetical protein